MTTQELVKQMNERASRIGGKTAGPFDVIDNPTADLLRAAASRLSEMEQERRDISMALGNQPDEPVSAAELVENIERISRIAGKGVIRLSEMEAENKRLREALTFAAAALHHLYSNIAEFGAVTDGEFLDGIHAAEQRARAALGGVNE